MMFYDMDVSEETPKARFLVVTKSPERIGYGFNLNTKKRHGTEQFIGSIDPGSPAIKAGLKEGDRIIEINGDRIGKESHREIVEKLKEVPNQIRLLVVDAVADKYCKRNKITIGMSMKNIEILADPDTADAETVHYSHDSDGNKAQEMGILCQACGLDKTFEEFCDDNLYDQCDHPPLICLRCFCQSKGRKCPYPGCDMSWTQGDVEETTTRIEKCEQILKYMFTAEPPGQSAVQNVKSDVLHIVCLDGFSFEMKYGIVNTIGALREKVLKKLKNPWGTTVKLTFSGKELEDDRKSLKDYKLEKGSVIHVQQLHPLHSKELQCVDFRVRWPYTGSYSETKLMSILSNIDEEYRRIHDLIVIKETEDKQLTHKKLDDVKNEKFQDEIDKQKNEVQKEIEDLNSQIVVLAKTKMQVIEDDFHTEFLDLSCIGIKQKDLEISFIIDKNNLELKNSPQKKKSSLPRKFPLRESKTDDYQYDIAIRHSGDALNDNANKMAHQEVRIYFDAIPDDIKYLVFVASVFVNDEQNETLTLERFTDIKLSLLHDDENLCDTDIGHALAFTSVVLCLVVREKDKWQVIESGLPSYGSILNYKPIEENIKDLIKQIGL